MRNPFEAAQLASELSVWVAKARQVEIHKGGNAQGLVDWYNNGADGQINWGSEGDFDACVAIAGKYLDNPQGFCQLRHIDATGEPTGHAAGEITKGDVQGHDFHGNQYTTASEVEDASERLANLPVEVGNREEHLKRAAEHEALADAASRLGMEEPASGHREAAWYHRQMSPDANDASGYAADRAHDEAIGKSAKRN